MAEIDPIMERREREAQEQKNKSLKNIMWALVAVHYSRRAPILKKTMLIC